MYMKRDLCIGKETYVYKKRRDSICDTALERRSPKYVTPNVVRRRDLCSMYMKRDLCIGKETSIYKKRRDSKVCDTECCQEKRPM